MIRAAKQLLERLTESLEAIFLSTFVLIGQNRQAEFQQARPTMNFILKNKSYISPPN